MTGLVAWLSQAAPAGQPWYLSLVVQLLVILGGASGIAAVFSIRPTRRKLAAEAQRSGADAAKILNDAAIELLDPAREQVAFLRSELASARSELADTRSEVQSLRGQVAELTAALETERQSRHGGQR